MKRILLTGLLLLAGNCLFADGKQEPPAPPSEWANAPVAEITQRFSPPVPPSPPSPAPPSPSPLPQDRPREDAIREQQTANLTLDKVIENSGKRIEEAVPGTKLAVLNFTSASEKFSDYVIEELTGVLVMGRKVTMVDRQNLALIRKEMELQLSGDVSDESAQRIGKKLGAQFIVSGSLVDMGTYYRFRVKVINVETATIEEQSSFNMRSDAQVAFLLGNVTPAAPVAAQPVAPAAVQPAAPVAAQPAAPVQPANQTQPGLYSGGVYVPAQPDTPAPQPKISADRAGLYVNGAYQGQMDLLDSIDWIKLNAKSGGNYVIVLGKDEAVPYIQLNFNNLQLSITLKASGAERKVRYDNSRPSYSLFVVGAGVTFILEDGITLSGLQRNSNPLVRVEGGNFTMNGGSIKDNKPSEGEMGGGVYIDSGAFTMNNGTISGNKISSYGIHGGNGGGVYVNKGTFTMNNGTISGNSTDYSGGGVYVNDSGTFTMLGGIISGNSAGSYGGGVYSRGIFTKSGTGGIIYGSNASEEQANKANTGHAVCGASYNSRQRNSTARISQALDSRKDGAAGGWE